MNIQYEEIKADQKSSFHIMVNPNLSDFFYWHFHPEFELVYIEAEKGNRHVGEHISQFQTADLVFIGSNIPHLNFDFGIKTPYEKIVLHIKPSFLGNASEYTPELKTIQNLFEKARHGISFGQETQNLLAGRLKELAKRSHFEQFIEVLHILEVLAKATDFKLLHTEPVINHHTQRDQDRINRIYKFVDEHFSRKIEIEEVANLSNLSEAAFCRYFKKISRLTFTQFLNHYRINQAKNFLLMDKNITETAFECGFESISYFNRTFKKITSENPLSFKKRHNV